MCSKDDIFLLAEHDNKIFGFIHLKTKDALVHDTLEHIRLVYSSIRKCGIASTLIMAAEVMAFDRGIDKLFLRVFKFNTNAIKLYKKLGYKKISSDKYSILMMKSI